MKRVSFTSLIRIFTLLVAIMSITSVQAKQYRVTTTSSLNVRSAPTTNSEKIASISSGEIVNVIETVSDGWMKIELDGTTGYVYGQYLEAVPEVSSTSKKESNFWNRETKFWTHFIIYIVLTIAFFILIEENSLIALLCSTGAAFCVWKYTGYGDSFWFLDFEQKGCFFLMLLLFLFCLLNFYIPDMGFHHVLGTFIHDISYIQESYSCHFRISDLNFLVFSFYGSYR